MISTTTSQWMKIQHPKREKLLNQCEYEVERFFIFKNHGKKY